MCVVGRGDEQRTSEARTSATHGRVGPGSQKPARLPKLRHHCRHERLASRTTVVVRPVWEKLGCLHQQAGVLHSAMLLGRRGQEAGQNQYQAGEEQDLPYSAELRRQTGFKWGHHERKATPKVLQETLTEFDDEEALTHDGQTGRECD